MARALWKGAISFGLVYIPVEMHTAVQSHDLDLTMLDRRDFAPIGFKRYNKNTGKDVAWDNIVKGYEYQQDDYVVLSDEDLHQANVEATQTIAIQAFVDAVEVPLTYFDTPYYLAPGRGGDKVFALLRETLRQTGRIAIATVVIRVRQHLCALVCVEDGIVLNTLRFAEEIHSTEELALPPSSLKAAGINAKELQMALSLVDGMTEKWQPEQYHDSYRKDVLALVEKKVKAGQTKSITADAPETTPASSSNVVDLVALLKQSLGSKGKAASTHQDKPATKPATKSSTKLATKSTSKPASKSVSKPAAKSAAKKAARPRTAAVATRSRTA